MISLQQVIENIQGIECPAGEEVKDRIKVAYKDYIFAGTKEILCERAEAFDKAGYEAYITSIDREGAPKIIFYVYEGADHYVATIVEAHRLEENIFH